MKTEHKYLILQNCLFDVRNQIAVGIFPAMPDEISNIALVQIHFHRIFELNPDKSEDEILDYFINRINPRRIIEDKTDEEFATDLH